MAGRAEAPRDLPRPFDYDLYVFHGTERIQGRDVPVVVFRESTRSVLGRAAPNPKGRAKVYILRADDTFDTRDMKPAGNSTWTVDVIRDRPGFVYVIVHTGELERFYRGWGRSPDNSPPRFAGPGGTHGLVRGFLRFERYNVLARGTCPGDSRSGGDVMKVEVKYCSV